MFRFVTFTAAALIALPLAGHADPTTDRCELRARSESGYSGGRIPEFEIGAFKGRISGSVAFGVSRSKGGAAMPAAPAFAGAYSVEQREAAKARDYQRIFDACVAGR